MSVSPNESKFRRIRLQNPKIRAAIADDENAVEVMRTLGWVLEHDAGSGEDFLVLPASKTLPMKDIRPIMDRQEALEKDSRKGSTNTLASLANSEA